MFKRKKNTKTQKRQTIVDSDSSSSDSDTSPSFTKSSKKQKIDTKPSATKTTEVSAPSYSSTIDHSHSKQLTQSEDATKETILYAKDSDDDSAPFSEGPYKVPFTKPTQTGTIVGLKAASNIKSTTSQDYQPDVCKDYKLTGFCGYGDSCKFLHMREDYKAGWQIEREWEIKEGGKKEEGRNGSRDVVGEGEGSREEKETPTTCPICTNSFTRPVITGCGHVFCEKCFLTKHKKKHNCFVCGENTKGACKPWKG